MLKVVHIIGSLERGGAERILENIITKQLGIIKHIVVSLDGKEQSAVELSQLGVKVVEVRLRTAARNWRSINGICRLISRLIGLVRTVKNENPDIIHTWMYHSDLIGGVIGKLLRVPVIWGVFLSNLNPVYYKKATNRLIMVAGKASRSLPTMIISCSNSGLKEHETIGYPKGKIKTIPVGVDTRLYSFSEEKRNLFRSQFKCANDSIVIGMVARWDPQKNFECFFRAASKLANLRDDVQFWLAGGYGITRENNHLMALESDNNLAGRVHYFGKVEDLVGFYCGLDIFTLTSFGEGLPNVVCEAMSCQLPCVASDVGDIAELLENGAGLLLDDDKPNHLLSRWQYLIENGLQERQLVGKKARRQVCSKYNSLKMSKQYLDIYKSILDKTHRIDRYECDSKALH